MSAHLLKSSHRRDILGFYIPWASDRSKLNLSFFQLQCQKFIFANNSCIDTTLLDSVRLMYRLTIKRGAASCSPAPPPPPHPILFLATHPFYIFPAYPFHQRGCAADFSLLNLPKGKSLGRSKPATNS